MIQFGRDENRREFVGLIGNDPKTVAAHFTSVNESRVAVSLHASISTHSSPVPYPFHFECSLTGPSLQHSILETLLCFASLSDSASATGLLRDGAGRRERCGRH